MWAEELFCNCAVKKAAAAIEAAAAKAVLRLMPELIGCPV